MTRLLVHVEGETEETFVNEVLARHLYPYGYSKIGARLLGNARSRERRGGIKDWAVVRGDIIRHLKEDTAALTTTMVDYYALPSGAADGWPGRHEGAVVAFAEKAATVQDALAIDLAAHLGDALDPTRFLPYVMMHEFEGLLFSDCAQFAHGIGRPDLAASFQQIRDGFGSPEQINDSPVTAPSKRVLALVPGYEKPLHGNLAALSVGLDQIRGACPLFNAWLSQLEKWPECRLG